MLVNLSKSLLLLDGSELKDLKKEIVEKIVDGEKKKVEEVREVPITARTIVSSALQKAMSGDENLSATDRESHFDLLLRVHSLMKKKLIL